MTSWLRGPLTKPWWYKPVDFLFFWLTIYIAVMEVGYGYALLVWAYNVWTFKDGVDRAWTDAKKLMMRRLNDK